MDLPDLQNSNHNKICFQCTVRICFLVCSNTLQYKLVTVAFLYLLLGPIHSFHYQSSLYYNSPCDCTVLIDRRLRKSLKKKTGEKEAGEEVHNLLEDAAKRRRPISQIANFGPENYKQVWAIQREKS